MRGFPFKNHRTVAEAGIVGIRINLTIVPGTNLHEKWMDVDGRTTPPACESPQSAGYGPGEIEDCKDGS